MNNHCSAITEKVSIYTMMCFAYDILQFDNLLFLHSVIVLMMISYNCLLTLGHSSSRIKGCFQVNYTWIQISRMRRSLEQIKQFEVNFQTKSIYSYNSKKKHVTR